jgi:hypothetical protein
MTIAELVNSANNNSNNSLLTNVSHPTTITTTGARNPGLRASQGKLTEIQFMTTTATSTKIFDDQKTSSAGARLPSEQRTDTVRPQEGREEDNSTTHPKEGVKTKEFGSTTSGPTINDRSLGH